MTDRVVERRADDGDVRFARPKLRWVGDPWQLHEADAADVGRQIEVRIDLVLGVPAVEDRKVGFVGALGHVNLRRRAAAESCGRGRVIRLIRGAAGSRSDVQRGAPGRWYTPSGGQPARNSDQAASTSAGSRKRSTAVWAISVAASNVVSSARGVTAASRKAVE